MKKDLNENTQKLKFTFLLIVCIICLGVSSASVLDYAEESANLLISGAPSNWGWEYKDPYPDTIRISPGMIGNAQIGLFFIQLYEITANETYLSAAKNTAQWYENNKVVVDNGIYWPRNNNNFTGYAQGSAGAVIFLRDLYYITDNVTYKALANDAVRYLESIVNITDGYHWLHAWPHAGTSRYYTSQGYGNAGIGKSFLFQYDKTGNETYKSYAESVADWLISVSFYDGSKRSWETYPLSGFSAVGTELGIAGILNFFLDLYVVTNNQTYLTCAREGIRWIESQAIIDDEIYYWTEKSGFYSSPYNLANYTGTDGLSGIGKLFNRMYKLTNNESYLFYAKKAAETLMYHKTNSSAGYSWPVKIGDSTIYVGAISGMTEIVTFFVDLYNITGNLTYLHYAQHGTRFILSYNTNDPYERASAAYYLLEYVDSDYDGLDIWDELLYNTNPNKWDTSENGLSDFAEVMGTYNNRLPHGFGPTDPLKWDTSGNGLSDFAEVYGTYNNGSSHGFGPTNPHKNDTDGDGLNDYAEIYGTYNDGTPHGYAPTNPNNRDSDGDRISDYDELYLYGTDPNNPDTDSDGICDYREIFVYLTDPTLWDTDGDGLHDLSEIMGTFNNGTSHGFGPTNPRLWDTSGNGLNDLAEILGTYNDGTPHRYGPTNPHTWDNDNDGLSDYEELYKYKTDPNNPDTSGDGIPDGVKVYVYNTDPLSYAGFYEKNQYLLQFGMGTAVGAGASALLSLKGRRTKKKKIKESDEPEILEKKSGLFR